MRASTAYFAVAGTVVMAIVAGLSGGLLMADIISPKSPKQRTEMTRLERRMSPEPIKAVSMVVAVATANARAAGRAGAKTNR